MLRTLLLGFCFSLAALCGPETRTHPDRAARGGDPAELVRTLDLACAHYQDIGETAQSELCLRRLLTLTRNLLGPDALSLNRLVNRLACVYIELRQPARAERLPLSYWLARLTAEAPLSTDRIDLLGTLAALALVRGKPAESIAFNREAWDIIAQRSETETSSAIATLNNLAIAYREAKRYPDSEETLHRALAIGHRTGLSDTLAMAYTHANLAHLHQALRRWVEADRDIVRTLAIMERRCGPSSPRTMALHALHATVLRKLGRKAEARTAETRARSAAAFTGHSVDVADLARRR